MRDQSTAHVNRADVAARRANDWLKVAEAHAPAGFDDSLDGVLIHRGGTVLYAGISALRLLHLENGESVVGSSLLELFEPADRERIAQVVGGPGREAPAAEESVETSVGRDGVVLLALHADDATPPVDVLYVCSERRTHAVAPKIGPKMDRVDGERTAEEPAKITVLICDDEARLGALTAGLLSEFGFSPLTADNGTDALQTLGQKDVDVAVVLLDVNLTEGPSATEVLASMLARGFRARVVLTSGLAEEDVSADLLEHPLVVGYVAKPYGVDQLVQSVRTALVGRSS